MKFEEIVLACRLGLTCTRTFTLFFLTSSPNFLRPLVVLLVILRVEFFLTTQQSPVSRYLCVFESEAKRKTRLVSNLVGSIYIINDGSVEGCLCLGGAASISRLILLLVIISGHCGGSCGGEIHFASTLLMSRSS